MAKDYSGRVSALKSRRQSETKRRDFEKSAAKGSLAMDSFAESRGYAEENYQKRTTSSALTYALGAMDEVDPRYTAISHTEADRIKNTLNEGLNNLPLPSSILLQGSLPLNVHIRRASDVDLLIILTNFFTYDSTGPKASSYFKSDKDKPTEILYLRQQCFDILDSRYHAVDVDNSKGKCITMLGGSLARDVDVVPALWFDSSNYQTSGLSEDRGVQILNKNDHQFSTNFPFLVKSRVDKKDNLTNGGCKKAIRLLKTLKTDADDNNINLSSFDIMSLVYSMDNSSLYVTPYTEGTILLSLQNYFTMLLSRPAYLEEIVTIDGTRKVIQSPQDKQDVQKLLQELDDLIIRIVDELMPSQLYESEKTADKILNKAFMA